MSIKNVVKVMNFHSLLRVNAAKRNAEKYFFLEEELSKMIDNIINNRNFILDKNIMSMPNDVPELVIYIGSDFGFCSNYNSQVNNKIRNEDSEADKIIIGKKIIYYGEEVILRKGKEEAFLDMHEINEIIIESIKRKKYSKISIIYNKYIDTGTINIEKKEIFPMQLEEKDSKNYIDDFTVEDDISEMLMGLISYYVIYEMRICLVNANASENVLRENTTRDSLKKIDEREEIIARKEIKERRAKDFRKLIENFTKQKRI